MTWSLIPMPAAEEMCLGYVPSLPERSGDVGLIRRFFVSLFVIIGLATGLQLTVADLHESDQRRLAEVSPAEPKGPCRDCAQQILILSTPEGNPRVPTPATPLQ